MFDYLTFGTLTMAGNARSGELGQVCASDEEYISGPPAQSHQPCPVFRLAPCDTDHYDDPPAPERHHESQASHASVEIITHKLNNSHLRVDQYISSLSLPQSNLTCPPSTPHCLEMGFHIEVDPRFEVPLSLGKSRHVVEPSTSSTVGMATSPYDKHHLGTATGPKLDRKQLRRQLSWRLLNDPLDSQAIQTLVEDMISSGTQCNVHTSTLASAAPIKADDTNMTDCRTELKTREADEKVDDGLRLDKQIRDNFMSRRRRANGHLGIRQHVFPYHPSSADAALLCKNLVRNKPRMRKRPKAR